MPAAPLKREAAPLRSDDEEALALLRQAFEKTGQLKQAEEFLDRG